MNKRKKDKSKPHSFHASGKPARGATRKRINTKSRQHDTFIAFDEWASEADDRAFRDL